MLWVDLRLIIYELSREQQDCNWDTDAVTGIVARL